MAGQQGQFNDYGDYGSDLEVGNLFVDFPVSYPTRTHLFTEIGDYSYEDYIDDIDGRRPIHRTITGTVRVCTPITATKTFYIDATTGSDTNNGITASTPWQTFAPLKTALASYIENYQALMNIHVYVGAGSYNFFKKITNEDTTSIDELQTYVPNVNLTFHGVGHGYRMNNDSAPTGTTSNTTTFVLDQYTPCDIYTHINLTFNNCICDMKFYITYSHVVFDNVVFYCRYPYYQAQVVHEAKNYHTPQNYSVTFNDTKWVLYTDTILIRTYGSINQENSTLTITITGHFRTYIPSGYVECNTNWINLIELDNIDYSKSVVRLVIVDAIINIDIPSSTTKSYNFVYLKWQILYHILDSTLTLKASWESIFHIDHIYPTTGTSPPIFNNFPPVTGPSTSIDVPTIHNLIYIDRTDLSVTAYTSTAAKGLIYFNNYQPIFDSRYQFGFDNLELINGNYWDGFFYNDTSINDENIIDLVVAYMLEGTLTASSLPAYKLFSTESDKIHRNIIIVVPNINTLIKLPGSVLANSPSTIRIDSVTIDNSPGYGLIGSSYSYTPTISGGKSPYNITVSGLPSGITYSSTTGALSGTLSSSLNPSTVNITYTITDSNNKQYIIEKSIIIVTAVTIMSSSKNRQGVINKSYTMSLSAEGGTGDYTWSKTSGTLPPGFIMESHGVATGTCTTPGTYTFTIRVTDNVTGSYDSVSITIIMHPELVITTTSLPSVKRLSPYGARIDATGGIPPYDTYITSSSPPTLIQMTNKNAYLNGYAWDVGTFPLSFQVLDTESNRNEATKTLDLTVTPSTGNIGCIIAQNPIVYTVGEDVNNSIYNWLLVFKQFVAPSTVNTTGLPPGLTASLDDTNSIYSITGTPTTAGVYNVTISSKDAICPISMTKTYVIIVRSPSTANFSFSNPNCALGIVGTPYREQLKAIGDGVGTPVFSIVNGTLPAGLTMNSDGAITGTPTTAGTNIITFRCTDDTNAYDEITLACVVVAPRLHITIDKTFTFPTQMQIGDAISWPFVASNGLAPYTYYITNTWGLSINSSTGVVTGNVPTYAANTALQMYIFAYSSDRQDVALYAYM
jgi:hypothetical protein